jgi:hypothetical protein
MSVLKKTFKTCKQYLRRLLSWCKVQKKADIKISSVPLVIRRSPGKEFACVMLSYRLFQVFANLKQPFLFIHNIQC